eukprot:scaffold37640_cov83-Cyclotella_meneghiniana.AAC.6
MQREQRTGFHISVHTKSKFILLTMTTCIKFKFCNKHVKTDNPDADFEAYRHNQERDTSVTLITHRINLVQKRIERKTEGAKALEYATQRANGAAAVIDGARSVVMTLQQYWHNWGFRNFNFDFNFTPKWKLQL